MDEKTFKLVDKGIIPFEDKLYKIIKFEKVQRKDKNNPDYISYLQYSGTVKKFECSTNLDLSISKEAGLCVLSRHNLNSFWEKNDSYIEFKALNTGILNMNEDGRLANHLNTIFPAYSQEKQREFEKPDAKDLNKF